MAKYGERFIEKKEMDLVGLFPGKTCPIYLPINVICCLLILVLEAKGLASCMRVNGARKSCRVMAETHYGCHRVAGAQRYICAVTKLNLPCFMMPRCQERTMRMRK